MTLCNIKIRNLFEIRMSNNDYEEFEDTKWKGQFKMFICQGHISPLFSNDKTCTWHRFYIFHIAQSEVWRSNMLDYAIFAVTFVGSLVAAVIYLYPVRLKPYAIVSNVPVIAITNICSVSVTFTLWFAESWTSLFMVWCFHLFSMFIVVTFGTMHKEGGFL